MIVDPDLPEATITTDDLEDYYHDVKGADECRGHTIHLVHYVPSMAHSATGHPVTPVTPAATASDHAPTTTHHVRPIG